MKKSSKASVTVVLAALAAAASTAAQAAAPTTLADLSTGVSFDAVGLSILAVTGAIIPIYVLWKGAKFVTRAVRGA